MDPGGDLAGTATGRPCTPALDHARHPGRADVLLLNLQRMSPKKYLYEMYSERVASLKALPIDPGWDGATNFQTK